MKILKYTFTLALSLVALPLLAQVWTAPGQTAPQGNVSTPLNVGPYDQTKTFSGGAGNLTLQGGLFTNGLRSYLDSYFDGKLGVGTVGPESKLQVLGTLFVNTTADTTGGMYYGGAANGLIVGKYSTSPWPGINGFYLGGPFVAAGTVKITSGTPGAGKVLTSDATGVATWTTPAAGGVTSVTGGTGISASPTTGAVALTNTGVTSIVAGTNVTVSGATGAVTINAASSAEADTLATVTGRGASTNSAITIPSLSFVGVGGDSGQPAPNSDYRIYQSPGAWTYPYPDLNIAYHTGIKLGAYWNYGGTRFYNNSDMVTELLSVGNGDNNIRVANNLGIGTGNGAINQSLVVGNDLGALAGGSSKGVVFGNTGGSFYHYIGQDTTHNLSSSWIYNATPSSAFAQIQTFSRANPLYVDGSQLYLNAQSSAGNVGIGTTNPGTKLEVAGTGYVQIDPNDGRLDIASGNDGFSYVDFKGSTNLASDYRGRIAYDDGAGIKMYTGGSGTASLAITEAGQIGIGTLVPSYKLDVTGGGISGGYTPGYLGWSTYGTGAGGAAIYNDNGTYKTLMIVGNTSAGGTRSVSIWDQLTVNGPTYASAYYYSSDKNLKKNIEALNGKISLDNIMKLKGVSFDWKKDGQHSVGLIAQDVEKVYPELVNTDKKTGLKSVEYGNLVAPLIEAVKEQQKQIDSLKKELELLKASK